MFTEKMKQAYPSGIRIQTDEMDVKSLHTLMVYPAERTLQGRIEKEPKLNADNFIGIGLLTEMRINKENYNLIEPSSDWLLSPLNNNDNEKKPGPELPASFNRDKVDIDDVGIEDRVADLFFHQYPDFIGGTVEGNLQKTENLMDMLYVENIPMHKVTEILLQHPHIGTKELKETLQLFDLMQRGVEILESGKRLTPYVNKCLNELTDNLQDIYTGKGKPLEGYPYYQNDVRPVYDREIKKMAELKLREHKMIQIRPQSFDDEQQHLHFHLAGNNDAFYVFENGTDGFYLLRPDRTFRRFGEELSPKNRAVFERLVNRENLMTIYGSLFLRPAGPERVFLEKSTGKKINVFQETVDGQQMLVQPYKLKLSRVQWNPEDFVETTGRITDARIIGKDYTAAISCRIDGERQSANRLSLPDAKDFKNGLVTAEQLAVKYFAHELMQTATIEQKQHRSFKR